MAFSYTLAQLTSDTLQQLRGTTRDEINILAADLDAPDALTRQTISLTDDLNGVTIGSLLVSGDETMYVLSASPEGVTATVVRGFDGTTPQAAASGSIVLVDPPWTVGVVRNRLRDEIRSWGPQLFAVADMYIPIVQQQRGYDLGQGDPSVAPNIIRILRVSAPQPPYVGSPGYWLTPGDSNTALADQDYSFEYDPMANTAEFPSGKSITLIGPTVPNVVSSLHVVYAAPFDVDSSWDDSTDMIADVGIDARDLDIPTLGAAGRLMQMMAARRAMLNVQGQSREDQDVTMQAILQGANQFKMDAQSRRGDVQQRLYSDWPIRVSTY